MNQVEDEMIDLIDKRAVCGCILRNEKDRVGLSKELRFLIRLILASSSEFFSLIKEQKENGHCGVSMLKLRQVLLRFGFGGIVQSRDPVYNYRMEGVLARIFGEEVVDKRNNLLNRQRYIIIRQKNNRKEFVMGNDKEGLRQLDMAEMTKVAGELGLTAKGKSKEKLASEIINHITELPEDEVLTESVVNWYNIAYRLQTGEAKTLEEAREQEAAEVASNGVKAEEESEVDLPEEPEEELTEEEEAVAEAEAEEEAPVEEESVDEKPEEELVDKATTEAPAKPKKVSTTRLEIFKKIMVSGFSGTEEQIVKKLLEKYDGSANQAVISTHRYLAILMAFNVLTLDNKGKYKIRK